MYIEHSKLTLPPGFKLVEEDDDFVQLTYQGEIVAVFHQQNVDPRQIEKIAAELEGMEDERYEKPDCPIPCCNCRQRGQCVEQYAIWEVE